MYLNKAYQTFIEESKRKNYDISLITVKETIGHCYAKVGNLMLINSNAEFMGVLGSPTLHEKLTSLSKEIFQSKKSIEYTNYPKDKTSGHGISKYLLTPFLYKDNYTLLEESLKQFGKPYSLLIFGSGAHVSSLISIANLMGWQTTVIDMKIHENCVYEADTLIKLKTLAEIKNINLNVYNAAVILSHSPKCDDIYLEALLKSKVEYIGILGNKTNMQKKRDEFNLYKNKRFFAPVGMNLGGITHESIALSIVAQIEARKNEKI